MYLVYCGILATEHIYVLCIWTNIFPCEKLSKYELLYKKKIFTWITNKEAIHTY